MAYALITFLPALFMFATTFVAGIEQHHVQLPAEAHLSGQSERRSLGLMLMLVIVIFFESIRKSVGFLMVGLKDKSVGPAIAP